jgi:pimeloyl-ACP methyl ester carboxylesterase
VAHYLARHGESRVAKAVLISSVPPLMVQTAANPGGLPKEVFVSQTDFTEDLKKISVPMLVMHGDDDQIVPYADSGPLTARLVRNATLKTYHASQARAAAVRVPGRPAGLALGAHHPLDRGPHAVAGQPFGHPGRARHMHVAGVGHGSLMTVSICGRPPEETAGRLGFQRRAMRARSP